MDDSANDNPLHVEIMAEKASAYFTRVRKMQSTLAALARFDATAASHDGQSSTRRDELLSEAAEQAFFFVIQREAMKLPYYDELFADFDIPDEVRRRMGSKR